ncbi:MAG: TIGR04282 family arsenosugar biosynthesis glycosyltransferase [Gammaproteobacteria bacterium]|nr:TIGR04282 family arsenosugar biosynthesis glycosyltransferase [Gammaproteobacteria bacterium]
MLFKYPDLRVLLFAKEPVYGQVKTRLHDAIGVKKAYDLHCSMLRYQVNNILDSGLAPMELWVSGNLGNPVLKSLPMDGHVYQQVGRDLGRRMQSAVVAAKSRSDAVVLVGTDCPSVDREYLESALELLSAGRQLVIGPAEDGGYVLLGIRENLPRLFEDIPWGTDKVLPLTLERANQLKLDIELLPSRWDVDRPEDLARLATLNPPLGLDGCG